MTRGNLKRLHAAWFRQDFLGTAELWKRNRRGSKPRAVGKDATSEERGETGKSEFSYSYFFFSVRLKNHDFLVGDESL